MSLPGQLIRRIFFSENPRGILCPFNERMVHHGMTYGLGPAGYDVRVAQDKFMWPWRFTLASAMEYLQVPDDIQVEIKDKSTWIRRGLHVHNTLADPGFRGHLTLELKNQRFGFFFIRHGDPICQLVFNRLEEPTEMPYSGKYQGQGPDPVPAILEEAR